MTTSAPPTGQAELSPDELVRLLVSEFSRPLYRVAVSIVRDHALAEDVVQESLVKAWLAFPTFRGEAPLRSWVLRIGHNVAVSTLRGLRDEPTDPASLPDTPTEAGVDRLPDRLAVGEVWDVLNDLDPLSRAILVLRDVEGYSYKEVAEISGASLATVKTRLFRTRKLVADRLEEWR